MQSDVALGEKHGKHGTPISSDLFISTSVTLYMGSRNIMALCLMPQLCHKKDKGRKVELG